MVNYKQIAVETTKFMIPGYGTAILIKQLSESVTKSTEVVDTQDIKKLENEVKIQELEQRIAEAQARVAQELAIAERIQNSAEVEIEEFYDVEGSGKAGVQYQDSSLNVGLSASGKKISKRVYKFKGFSPHIQITEENISEE